MTIFNSFVIGGFECADHINRSGDRVNLLRETQHDSRVREDYRLLAEAGICTVREGLCWSRVETRPYQFDFSEVRNRYRAAEEYGIQQIWDLCHFGYPDGIYPTHPHFCSRFVALCDAFAAFHASTSSLPLFAVPINEISFLSWHSGDVRGTVPFAINCGFDIKYHLCKAAIAGSQRLREILPGCRLLTVEPMIRIHDGRSSLPDELHQYNEAQFQAMDMLAGRMCPELGGTETFLDILGFNYYWDCQWQLHGPPLPWPETVPARVPLASLLGMVYARYERPLLLSETGHFGNGRAAWLDEVCEQCLRALEEGVDLQGICLYPVIDRPDWDNLEYYHNSGLWDLDAAGHRIAHTPYMNSVNNCSRRFNEARLNKVRAGPAFAQVWQGQINEEPL